MKEVLLDINEKELTPSKFNDDAFKKWNANYLGYDVVFSPPSWKTGRKQVFTFVYIGEEISADEYLAFFRICRENHVLNPRVFTPWSLSLSSIYHPSFFSSLSKKVQLPPKNINRVNARFQIGSLNYEVSDELDVASVKYYLQSLVFLSGVTLSAAIVQNRWSHGTIESKLNRLWQVAHFSKTLKLEKLESLDIRDFVLNQAEIMLIDPVKSLIEIKHFYSVVLKELMIDLPASEKEIQTKKLNSEQELRFGFIDELAEKLGENLSCVILYGSAIKSKQFADYDLIVIVDDLSLALNKMAGTSPMYNGLELNMSIFDESDFWTYQMASGDNLMDHAICLYGSAKVPHKSKNDLLARNFSFGFIRYRQLLGMSANLEEIDSETDDKKNLLDYFVKIPLNVAKGILGSQEKPKTNEEIKEWFAKNVDFNVEAEREKLSHKKYTEAISSATCATLSVLKYYSEEFKLHDFI